MGEVDFGQLLRFSRELHRANDLGELMVIVRRSIEALTGYAHAWLSMFEPDREHVRMLAISAGADGPSWDQAQLIPVRGDAMLAELLEGSTAVVVEDARTDPRPNKALVDVVGNRTIINVPLMLFDSPMGALGTGTFGAEGPRPPTAADLENLMALAAQVSVAAARLRWLADKEQAEKERRELERRLYQAQRLESLGVLAGGLAHDFSNLLQVVASHAQFVTDGPLTSEQRADMATILEAAERGTTLARQLLAMGRRQPQTLAPLDVNERLRALSRMLGRLLPANIAVDVIEGHQLPNVLADAAQLDQVLLNLAMNARDAMPQGGRLHVETELVLLNGAYVRAHPWAKPGRYLLITVSDTGVGMAPEVLERVFEPFYTTKAPGAGSGLGLAVAYGIVQQHGGMMHAYSELGVGTTFKVYLPAYERPATSVGDKLAPRVVGGTEAVLVAEDDPNVQQVIRRILEGAGYAVTAVDDGQAAVEAVQAGGRFEAIVLDAMMPRLGGRGAYERIRALGHPAAFLFSSGYTAEMLPEAVLTEEGVEMLQKPYDPDTLLRALRRALDRRRGP